MPNRLCSGLLAIAILVPPMAASAGPATGSAPSPPPPATALWVLPLAGPPAVTRPFDPPPHRYAAGHRGADLVAAVGAEVLAAGDGTVVFAGRVAGRPVVSIDHPGGLRTTYEPVEAAVGAGRPVVRGHPIGTLVAGHAGCPVEACLHWGVRRGEAYLDALSLLTPPRVRLLPNP